VRERFEAVEIPLNRIKKSRNARQKLFFSDIGLPPAGCWIHQRRFSMRAQIGLLKNLYEFGFGAGYFVAGCFAAGLETPMLISRKLKPLRSVSSNRMSPLLLVSPVDLRPSLLVFGRRPG
jgi:hypothetical protein